MDSNTFFTRRFNNVQALRGIASIFIILEHIRFLNCGAFGVDIFFCISGFMIMFSTEKSTDYFLSKRFLRIVPLYYLMTIATYLILLLAPSLFAYTTSNPIFLLKSLFFIPFEISDGIIQPLLRIGWTVNCEIFFYILFFVSLKISRKFRGLICSLFLLLTVLLGQLFSDSVIFLRFYGDYVMLEFIYGIIAFYIIKAIYDKNYESKLPKIISILCLILAASTFAILVLTKNRTNILGYRRMLVWGLPALLIVMCVIIAEIHIILPKPFIYLGNMSFSIYLLHYYPVQFLDRKVFHFDSFNLYTCLGSIICVMVSLLLAWGCYEIIEKRMLKKMSDTLLKK